MSLAGRLVRRLLAVAVGPLIAWVSDNALPVAGAVGALVAGAVIYGRLRAAGALAGPTLAGAVPAGVWSVVGASPAYALAVLVGVGVFLFWRR